MFDFLFIFVGITFGIALIISGPTAVVFIGLKLFGSISWSWGETLIPLYIMLFSAVALFIMYIYSLFD